MDSFSVVAMVRETPEVVAEFVDYYRRLGASEIYLYHNGPANELPAAVDADITVCTPEFWAAHFDGPVTDGLEDRQNACYRHCYARCSSDWLLVVDADEFVFGDQPLAPLLGRIPRTVDSIFFPTAEAVFGPGDDVERPWGCSHFRTPWTRQRLWNLVGRAVYGDTAALMNSGVMGHAIGKHMVRTGLPLSKISGHRSRRDDVVIGVPAAQALPELAAFHLAHYDALSRPRWEAKWRYRLDGVVVTPRMAPSRRAQMQMISEALSSGRGEALFRRLYGLGPVQYRALALFGAAFRHEGVRRPVRQTLDEARDDAREERPALA